MSTHRILVVDDEDGLREVLSDVLDLEGYVVESCSDINAAKEKLSNGSYDLAMLDIYLTDEPLGITLGQHILSNYPETKIIIMTGYAEAADIQAGYLSGAYACIRKPFVLDDVVRVVDMALGSDV